MKHTIGQRLPLAQVARAHDLIEEGSVVGNVVLDIPLTRRRLLWVCAVIRRRFSSGCKSHPATAPAGSNRSSHGGNEMAEAFG